VHGREVIRRLQDDGWYEVNQVGKPQAVQTSNKEGQGNCSCAQPRHTDWHIAEY